MKVVIVGGVAAGAGTAARLRRLDERAEIVLLERGRYISYANCGLPYHLGGVIPERGSLLVMPEAKFKAWFNVDVRTGNAVTAVDRKAKTVHVRRTDGSEYDESYDRLVLATGSRPLDLGLSGSDDPRVRPLWTIPDMDALIALTAKARRAVVVGGGFVGLEAAENLRGRGLEVTLIQHSGHVLPSVDPEMASYLMAELASVGIDVRLNTELTGFRREADGSFFAEIRDGDALPADLVLMSVGVRPNSELARDAGLTLSKRGHIVVDDRMRTSDADIYAAGDAVEVADPLSGGRTAIPLAGPANRQARIVADNLAGGDSRYRGSWGTSVIKIGKLTAASVGYTEARLKQEGLPYHRIYTHPASGATYYPGGAQMHIKFLFAPDGRIYGAQAVGPKAVDKRIDVIATAMQCGRKAPELAELELAYAPPFSSAKDPVNFLGMIADDILRGRTAPVYADAIPADAQGVDVREPGEVDLGDIPGFVNIPLGQLRKRLGELDRSRPVVLSCQVGLRGYLAERILKQNGFEAHNLSGGYLTWKSFHGKAPAPKPSAPDPAPAAKADATVDVRMLACPGPVVRIRQAMDALPEGGTLEILAALSFESDLEAWCRSAGHTLLRLERGADSLTASVRKGMPAVSVSAAQGSDARAIVLFSNDLDKAMAALIIACGMAAAGMKVSIFFTFWGLTVLRRKPEHPVKKTFISRLFGWMLPSGARRLALSKMHMMGIGTAMMKSVMADRKVPTLPELLERARELGVRFIACEMAMDVMGITRDELLEVDEVGGVASFAALSKDSSGTLFI